MPFGGYTSGDLGWEGIPGLRVYLGPNSLNCLTILVFTSYAETTSWPLLHPSPPVEFPSPTAQNRDNFELIRQKSDTLLVYFSDRRVIVREQIIENVDKTSKAMSHYGFPNRSRAISTNFKIPARA